MRWARPSVNCAPWLSPIPKREKITRGERRPSRCPEKRFCSWDTLAKSRLLHQAGGASRVRGAVSLCITDPLCLWQEGTDHGDIFRPGRAARGCPCGMDRGELWRHCTQEVLAGLAITPTLLPGPRRRAAIAVHAAPLTNDPEVDFSAGSTSNPGCSQAGRTSSPLNFVRPYFRRLSRCGRPAFSFSGSSRA